MSTRLDGDGFRQFISAANDALERNRAEVDALNVFPVPDGDTGSNMALTVRAAWQEAANSNGASLTAVAEAVSLGSLMGARGNSGVILSQLLRGFARGVEGSDDVDGSGLARALQDGVSTAYDAVMRPVEGTMLTVAREAAHAAQDAARRGGDIIAVLEAVVLQSEITLAHTPELLPVLKRAGVVDAGGKGLLYMFEAGLCALRDGSVPEHGSSVAAIQHAGAHVTGEEEVGEYPYDSQLLLRGEAIDLSSLRQALEPLGDSLLVVGSPTLVKVHVHTLEPDLVLRVCLGWGQIDQVEILDMRQQYSEFAASRAAGQLQDQSTSVMNPDASPGRVGVVAVAMGDGLIEIFRSLGVSAIVPGGQTMNPSIEDILVAVRSVGAESVIVLPNNKNVIPAAQQAAALEQRDIRVLPTRTIPQGLAALLELKPHEDPDANLVAMQRAADRVRTGLVTFAVRDAVGENGVIREGSILGLVNGQIQISGEDRSAVAMEVVCELASDDTEVITLFYGEGVTSAEADQLALDLAARYHDHEVELRYGGQPHYYYIIAVE